MAVNSTSSIQVSNVTKNKSCAPARGFTCTAEKVKLEKTTQKELEKLMPRMIKIINKFSRLQGEVPNIIINAIGTGLVAPIFIKYNFLSKTDEDTRTYTAWRQPVSAVLAIGTQAGMILPFNNLVTRMNNKGEFSDPKYNTTAFPDPKYIEGQLKKEGCKLTGKELEDLAKQKYNENIDRLVSDAIKHNKVEYSTFDGKTHSSHMVPKEELKQILDSVANRMKEDVDSTLKRYETEKPEHQIQRGEYLRKNHKEVRTILNDIEKQIKDGKSFNEINKGLKAKLKELKANNSDDELKAIIEQLSKQLDNPTLAEEVKDLKVKCDAFGKCSSIEQVNRIINGRLAARKTELKHQQKAIDELLKGIKSGESIGQLHRKLTKSIKDNQFVYDVIQKHISNVKANVKGLNQIIGILVGVAMLPLTCTLLNYLYPRFMDTFFPSLSNKKKPHDNDTFVKVNGTIPMEVPEDKKGGKL